MRPQAFAILAGAPLLLILAGCGSAVSFRFPSVSLGEVQPRELPHEGGSVTVTARVSTMGAGALRSVKAGVSKADSSAAPEMLDMTRTTDSSYLPTYVATLAVPPYSRADDRPQEYRVTVQAVDAEGDQTTESWLGFLTVTPP